MRWHIMLLLVRVILYKFVAFVRICSYTMFEGVVKNIVNQYSALNRTRKLCMVAVVILVLFLYLLPSWLPVGNKNVKTALLDVCIEAKLTSLGSGYMDEDFIVKHVPLEKEEVDFIPFVGNGYIGVAAGHDERLYVRYNRALSLAVPFYPNVQINIVGFSSQEAFATNIRMGLVNTIQCFNVQSKYGVTVIGSQFAHRYMPEVLVQEFRIHNPSDSAVSLTAMHNGASSWEGVTTETKRLTVASAVIDYKVLTGLVKPPDSSTEEMVVALAYTLLPDSISLPASSSNTLTILTVVKYSLQPFPVTSVQRQELAKEVEAKLGQALQQGSKSLKQSHQDVCDKLWYSGFGISKSRAPGAVNGAQINMTLYNVVSHTLAPIHSTRTTAEEKTQLNSLMFYPHRCYEGHQTLQMTKLWTLPTSVNVLIDLVTVWKITMDKQGCSTLLEAGADGVIQAMMLSLGPLQFKDNHLEYRAEPSDLHRNFYFRRLMYGNNTHLNISVVVNDDNKARMYVALDRNDRPYYACDAGCIDEPKLLSREMSEFPIKLTQPLTAILYVTSDEIHMKDLKHAIHVKELAEAPAHEHHVIAIHKHGHHLGGLPVLFWGSISVLIILFHVFLFKLIYNEYCGSAETPRYQRGRYQV